MLDNRGRQGNQPDLRRVASNPNHWYRKSFGIMLVRKPRMRFLLTLVWPVLRHFAESVFAEDRMAVEAEQRAYDRQGGGWNQEVFPVTLDLRRLLLRQGIAPADPLSFCSPAGRGSEGVDQLGAPSVSAGSRRDGLEDARPTR